MTDQIINLITRIFFIFFFNCQAFFIFDNTANHAYYTKKKFLAKKINLDIGEKELWIKSKFNNTI